MKKLLAICALLLLASCLDVEDFGTMWSKTLMDPALPGTWLRIFNPTADEHKTFPEGQTWTFTQRLEGYQVQVHRDGVPDDEPGYPVKSLILGHYTFLALGPQKGSIIRYTLKDDTLTLYRMDFRSLWDFIAKNFPDVQSFIKDDYGSKKDDMLVKIKHFDENAEDVLKNIPDNELYWIPDIILQKVNPPDNGVTP